MTQALPNGYCGLPVQGTCPHANACLTCPVFVTAPEFLPQHREQRQQLLQIVSAAEARGQAHVVETNRQVLGNLTGSGAVDEVRGHRAGRDVGDQEAAGAVSGGEGVK
ncbi:hypothetical protein ACIRP5_31265 [Streptomyces sp. NPDC101221]|uniref:hypothetical protein n=1 Tax=Streptomyces sp. NPDC101221 TaxID=3366132 RepID=UPI0037FFE239